MRGPQIVGSEYPLPLPRSAYFDCQLIGDVLVTHGANGLSRIWRRTDLPVTRTAACWNRRSLLLTPAV